MILTRPLILDFDSTLIQTEGLDELAALCLKDKPDVLEQLKWMTSRGMSGGISFASSLKSRLDLFSFSKSHIAELITQLKTQISPSFEKNKAFLKKNTSHIYVISGGFEEYILPITTSLGILSQNVYANRLIFDKNNQCIGYDQSSLMAQDNGKSAQLRKLNFNSKVYVVGDGMTDFEMSHTGLVEVFFAFTENIKRESVLKVANRTISSFDEFLDFLQKQKGHL